MTARDWRMEVLRGRVISGVGDLANRMMDYADLYEAKTGVHLYPGSLNVVLGDPWHVGSNAIRVEPPECPVAFSIVASTIGKMRLHRADGKERPRSRRPPSDGH
ncbi:MAG: hypothetical protein WBG41_07255 [Acidimicrobiales bacterium]